MSPGPRWLRLPLFAALLLAAGHAPAGEPAPAAEAPRCLPADDGYLRMRLGGSLEGEYDWRGPELECRGMSRPGGDGLRLRFAGPAEGEARLVVLLAAGELGEGESARGLPLNLTILDEGQGRIYGTRGDDRCTLDAIEQQALDFPALPPRSYRVSGRGFCTKPARALDGEGAVLMLRFDFAGLVVYREDDGAAPTGAGNAR